MKEDPMEARIATIETDLRNFKENAFAKLFDGLRLANEAITQLLTGQAELRGDINTLRAEMGTVRAEMGTIRAEMGTVRAEMGIVRAEMGTLRSDMKGGLEALEAKMMRWFVATTLSCAGLGFAAARLFH